MTFLEETDSTNKHVKRLIDSQGHPDAPRVISCCAFRQTGGKGRNGRRFMSDDGGVYVTVAIRDASAPLKRMPMSAIAVSDAIKSEFGLDTGIKWVNDIVFNGKKCAGILGERHGGYTIIGIGVNVCSKIDGSIADIATALLAEKSADRDKLATFARKIEQNILSQNTSDNSWLEPYGKRSVCLGKHCTLSVPDGAKIAEGTAVGFTAAGGIVLRTGSGTDQIFETGELSLRIES